MQQRYYKFRCLQNLKHFIDIILNKRLYAPRYDELNDPMEGLTYTPLVIGYLYELIIYISPIRG
jgi:hypothetical protein